MSVSTQFQQLLNNPGDRLGTWCRLHAVARPDEKRVAPCFAQARQPMAGGGLRYVEFSCSGADAVTLYNRNKKHQVPKIQVIYIHHLNYIYEGTHIVKYKTTTQTV